MMGCSWGRTCHRCAGRVWVHHATGSHTRTGTNTLTSIHAHAHAYTSNQLKAGGDYAASLAPRAKGLDWSVRGGGAQVLSGCGVFAGRCSSSGQAQGWCGRTDFKQACSPAADQTAKLARRQVCKRRSGLLVPAAECMQAQVWSLCVFYCGWGTCARLCLAEAPMARAVAAGQAAPLARRPLLCHEPGPPQPCCAAVTARAKYGPPGQPPQRQLRP